MNGIFFHAQNTFTDQPDTFTRKDRENLEMACKMAKLALGMVASIIATFGIFCLVVLIARLVRGSA